MAWRDDRHRHAGLERRPAATAVVEHELEHAVSVGDAESDSVQARFARDREERGSDVRVEHRELNLEVAQPGVRRPSLRGIVLGDVGLKRLWTTSQVRLTVLL